MRTRVTWLGKYTMFLAALLLSIATHQRAENLQALAGPNTAHPIVAEQPAIMVPKIHAKPAKTQIDDAKCGKPVNLGML